jgi:hypothetical protein
VFRQEDTIPSSKSGRGRKTRGGAISDSEVAHISVHATNLVDRRRLGKLERRRGARCRRAQAAHWRAYIEAVAEQGGRGRGRENGGAGGVGHGVE